MEKKYGDKMIVLDIEYAAKCLGSDKHSIEKHDKDKTISIDKDQYKDL